MAAIPLVYSGIKMGLEQLISPRASLKSPRIRPREDPVSPLEAGEDPPGPPVKRVKIDTSLMEAALSGLNSPKGAPDLFSKSQSRSRSRSEQAQERDVQGMEEPEQVADPRGEYKQWSEDLIEAIIKQGGNPEMVMGADIRSWYNIASNPGAHRSRD